MIEREQYELLDFGQGRKLERFGDYVLDRPSPPAAQAKRARRRWEAAARFRRSSGEEGRWTDVTVDPWPPESWELRQGPLVLELRPTPFGHLGVFPEQFENWEWIGRQVRRAPQPPRVLNLFAYTGGSTLAAAAAGAEVTHVDAAKSVVNWARGNAARCGLAEAPIRWLHEDVRKFVARELRRGRRYDGVILDPPSYGHGADGQPWRIARDLPPLLEACAELTGRRPAFLLLSCHSPGFGPAELEAVLADRVFGSCQAGARAAAMHLVTRDGRRLAAGVAARWPGGSDG